MLPHTRPQQFACAAFLISLVPVAIGVEIHKIETPELDLSGQALSGDGKVVGGKVIGAGAPHFRWSLAGGYQELPEPDFAYASLTSVLRMNHDGSAVLGSYNSNSITYRWTETGGYLAPVSPPGLGTGVARGISGDGTIVVGDRGTTGTGFYAFRYDGGGYTVFDDVGDDALYYLFHDVSADGRYAVGTGRIPPAYGDRKLFRHDFNTGLRVVLAGSNFNWSATAISADAGVVIGSQSNTAISPFRWDVGSGGVTLIGSLDPTRTAYANDLDGDGSVIVGRSLTETGSTAFVWDAAGGIRSLAAYVTEKGGSASAWTFSEALGISDDGDAVLATGTTTGFFNGPVLITGLAQPEIPSLTTSLSPDGSQFSVSFESVSGQEYWLEESSLTPGDDWEPVAAPMAGTGSSMTLSVLREDYPSDSHFFRVATQEESP